MGLIDNNSVFIAREDEKNWKCSKMESDSKGDFDILCSVTLHYLIFWIISSYKFDYFIDLFKELGRV